MINYTQMGRCMCNVIALTPTDKHFSVNFDCANDLKKNRYNAAIIILESLVLCRIWSNDHVDPYPKLHGLVHNGGFPKFEALYCSLNMLSSIEIS